MTILESRVAGLECTTQHVTPFPRSKVQVGIEFYAELFFYSYASKLTNCNYMYTDSQEPRFSCKIF